MAKLTDKQKKLVQGIVKGLSHKEAYLKAGYSKNMKDNSITTAVNKILKKTLVKSYHEELQAKVTEKAEKETIASALELKEFLTRVVRGEEEEPTITADGVYHTEPKIQTKIKAVELLGKTHAMFIEKREVTAEISGDVKVNNPFAELTTEQLRKLADTNE